MNFRFLEDFLMLKHTRLNRIEINNKLGDNDQKFARNLIKTDYSI